MNHAALFNGIGGFQLAASWMEWDNVMSCEIDEFCNKITKYYFPNCIQYVDIKTTDFTVYRGKIDIITGGFPCQPYSAAGKRLGKADDRHLWPEMLRAIKEIQPDWVVGENVFGLLNWNGGMVLNEIKADLEAAGFEVFPPLVLPAVSVNAPHRRDRVWIVAYSNCPGQQQSHKEMERGQAEQSNGLCIQRDATNTNSNGLQGWRQEGNGQEAEGQAGQLYAPDNRYRWENFPSQPPICSGNDGFSIDLDRITFPKWRNESIKAYGNAIVPQVVYQIFKTIEKLS